METMNRRFVAFLMMLFGAAVMFFGAMYGQGMQGTGLFFGAADGSTSTAGALIGIAVAAVTLVVSVLLMFVRDVRPLVVVALAACAVGTLAAGLLFGIGALLALLGSAIALTVDREAPLT
jgi:hypothetical protein